MPPAERAFAAEWPEARTFHILDESLSADADAGWVADDFLPRFALIGDYCAAARADAVLFTCSAFADAIGQVKRRHAFPVLTPNEALFERILATPGPVAVLVTFEASVASLQREFIAMADARGAKGNVEFHFVPDAFMRPDHDEKVLAACLELEGRYEALAFAQFSMAVAAPAARAACKIPVWDTPTCAVHRLRELIQDKGDRHA